MVTGLVLGSPQQILTATCLKSAPGVFRRCAKAVPLHATKVQINAPCRSVICRFKPKIPSRKQIRNFLLRSRRLWVGNFTPLLSHTAVCSAEVKSAGRFSNGLRAIREGDQCIFTYSFQILGLAGLVIRPLIGLDRVRDRKLNLEVMGVQNVLCVCPSPLLPKLRIRSMVRCRMWNKDCDEWRIHWMLVCSFFSASM